MENEGRGEILRDRETQMSGQKQYLFSLLLKSFHQKVLFFFLCSFFLLLFSLPLSKKGKRELNISLLPFCEILYFLHCFHNSSNASEKVRQNSQLNLKIKVITSYKAQKQNSVAKEFD